MNNLKESSMKKFQLNKFFPHNTKLANHFAKMLSTLFPFREDEIVRFCEVLDLDLLVENPNILWTKELVLKFKEDILYTSFFDNNKNFIWDLDFLRDLNIDSKLHLNLEERLINFSWDDYLIINYCCPIKI